MKSTSFLLSGLLACLAHSASIPHRVHEKRQYDSPDWLPRGDRPHKQATVPLSFALTQQNLHLGPESLMSISDPTSANFGKHWTAQEVVDTFSPPQSTIDAVVSWLLEVGVSEERITISGSRNWIKVNSTIIEAETLLKTEYKVYEHKTTGKRSLAVDEYSLPLAVRDHIEFVTPTVRFAELTMKPKVKRSDAVGAGATKGGPPVSSWDLTYCSNYSTPACLRELYNIPNGTLDLSSFGIIDFVPDNTYRKEDLKQYLQTLSPQIPSGTNPSIQLIDETTFVNTTAGLAETETLLDISLAIALAYPQEITLITPPLSIDDGDQTADDYILEAFDASYCAVAASNTSHGGNCGTAKPPSVISVSWGGPELPENSDIYIRQCNEYLKLGLQGHTLIFSSGDDGVAQSKKICCKNKACAPQETDYVSTDTTFLPGFPASCPWVTTVGATRIAEGACVDDDEVVAFQNQTTVVNGTVSNFEWSSGGGFSNVFDEPFYQRDALRYYYDNFKPAYTSKQYNDSECTRGYPDVSANGVNILLVNNGQFELDAGTSASAPIFASIITLINQQRIKAKKSTVGFLNPVLYKNADAFNDIVKGSNPGCGTKGFNAVKGWDPVTGLGTPDYDKLLDIYMALP